MNTFSIRLLAGALLLTSAPATVSLSDPTQPLAALCNQVDSLLAKGQGDSALVLVEAGLETARRSGDPRDEIELQIRKGTALRYAEGPTVAEAFLVDVVERARSRDDCHLLAAALSQLAQAIDAQGRTADAAPHYEEIAAVSEACSEPVYLSRAQAFLGRRELRAGRFEAALVHIERALEVARSADLDAEWYPARFLQGLVFIRLGRPADARRCWEESADWARRSGESWSVLGSSLNNLGRLEMSFGDPSRAVRYWQEAQSVLVANGRARAAITPAKNGAIALVELGRYDESIAILEEQLKIAEERGYADHALSLRVDLARVELRAGRREAADARIREVLPQIDPVTAPEVRARAVLAAAEIRSELGEHDALIAWMSRELETLRERVDAQARLLLERTLGAQLERAGRVLEAKRILEWCRGTAEDTGLSRELLALSPALARVELALGQPAAAAITLHRGADAWEHERGVPEDPDWREARGELGAEVFSELAALLRSDPPDRDQTERNIAAFDAVQGYRTRTLQERIAGPGLALGDSLPATERATYSRLRSTLRSGEAYLEILAGPVRSVLFVVSEDGIASLELPGAEDARPALEQYREVLRTMPGTTARAAAARHLADVVLAGGLAAVGPARRLLFSPDGPWQLLPLATLPDPETGSPLLSRREVVRVPSAAVLIRTRAPAPAGEEPRGILALAGRRGPEGLPLPGADREVRRLERSFQGVSLRLDDSVPTMAELQHWSILHLAAHTVVNDARPWRSGFMLGDPRKEGGWLRASDVARGQLDARLAVLSGCDTASGRVLAGEGVLGLTSAFLAAGVPAVVSTMWPVDDAATADLMAGLYDRLAAGQGIAAALRGVQWAAAEAGSPPAEWAAFVVVGDGDTHVSLQRRQRLPATLLLAIGLVGLLAAGFLRRRRAKSFHWVVP